MQSITSFFPSTKRKHVEMEVAEPFKSSPLKILTWNANGIATRIQNNQEFEAFGGVIKQHEPDIICIQEVKLAAQGPPGCVKGDGRPRRRDILRQDNKQDKEEAQVVLRALRCRPFSQYNPYWTLSDWRYAGQLVLLKKGIRPLSIKFSLDPKRASHHPDGRVAIMEFVDFEFMSTYSPNHGWEESHWQRRDQWDREVCHYLETRRQKLDAKPFVWVGDLNVAPTDFDLTHPDWFRGQLPRIQRGKAEVTRKDVPAERKGQPGCADAERQGFRDYLKSGDLIDAFRTMYPEGPPKNPTTPQSDSNTVSPYDVDTPHWSWRGTPGIERDEFGRYFAKGMRIDHMVSSDSSQNHSNLGSIFSL